MPKVFISYSHKDEEWKDKLVSHLSVLEKEELLSIWTDRNIQGGDDWYSEIEKAIETAQVAILMISANFLTSDFILKEEIPRFLKKRMDGSMKILPLIIKPCAWQKVKWLSPIQGRPKDGRALSGGTAFQVDKDLAAFAKEVNDILDVLPIQTDEKTTSYFPPNKIDLTKLPDTDATLFGREAELNILDDAWENPQTKIISLIAWGGVGKSALTNAWLNVMDLQNFKGAEQIYGWSFYSQGTKEDTQASADAFLNDALKWFGFEGDPPSSQFDKGRRLAAQIANKKTLLILDGLEPLQYPPGEMHGQLKDQAMIALLKGLSRSMNGLCIITSRVEVSDLKSTEGRMSLTHPLKNLDEDAGKSLLEEIYQLQGTDEALKTTSREFKGHALALNLLGSYLKTVHDGDIRKRDLIPALMEDEKNGGHARRVMESYERWFAEGNKPELDILYLLGLFDRPASKEAIDVLRAEPAIPGLTDRLADLSFPKWKTSLQHLRDLRLIAKKEDNSDNLDCHPLIREHFGEKLQQQNANAWQEAHARLYEHYKHLPEKELPDTLEEMEPLFAAVRHGCLAGKYQEALNDIFWKRIRRENEAYINNKLGAVGSNLACLSAFFESPWDRPVSGLIESDNSVLLGWSGFALRAVGRLREAAQPMKAALEMRIAQKNWDYAAMAAGNLSELLLTLGDVKTAQQYAKQSVDFADRSKEDFMMEIELTVLADACSQAGNSKEAEILFLEAENMQDKRQPQLPFLHGLAGFQYCELLISFGRYQEVEKRAKTTIKWVNDLLSIALDKLSIGQAYMLQSLQDKTIDFSKATDLLNQAVEGLRKVGYQDDLPRGLLARTSLFRHQKNFPFAWTDLDEAREIAEYGSMQLFLADYYLEGCRVIYAQLKVDPPQSDEYEMMENDEVLNWSRAEMEEKFRLFFAEAERLVNACGYHRRDVELEELRVLGKAL